MCIATDLYFDRFLSRFSSVYDWFKDAEKNSADANALIKAIHYYCSLNLAPYDTFMCDLLHEVESGEGEKVEKITLPEVKECTENGCLDKFIPSGDRFEPFRTVMSAITGWKVEDDEKDVAAVIHADFEKCRAEHVNGNNCLSFLYVKEACSAICKATKCRVKAYFGSDSKPCREAVTSSCHKMYEEADKLCLSMHKSITADFPEHKCEEDW